MHRSERSASLYRVALVLLALAATGCSKPSAPASPEAPSATAEAPSAQAAESPAAPAGGAVPAAESPAGQVPAVESASCVYTEGLVEINRAGSWAVLDIGDPIASGDTVRSGPDGLCDIRLGSAATLRLRPDTVLLFNALELAEAATRIDAYLGAGEVLNKVQTLAGNEAYTIRTDTSICGVRGTEFSVSVGAEGSSTVAVNKGAVAVLAASPVIDVIADASAASGLAAAVLRAIIETAPVVAESQELTLGASDLAAADKAYRDVAVSASIAVPADLSSVGQAALSLKPGAAETAPALAEPEAAVARKARARLAAAAGASKAKPRAASAASKALFGAMRAVPEPTRPAGGAAQPLTMVKTAPGTDSAPAVRASEPASQSKAVVASWKAASAAVSGGLVRVGGSDLFALSDDDGTVYGFSSSGDMLWSVATANRKAEKSYPVPFKGLLYYSGASELVAIEAQTGAVVYRQALEGNRSHSLGSRVAVFPSAVVSPTKDALEVLDERTGSVKGSVAVPGGTMMSPVSYNGLAAIVNQKGVFMLIDIASGEVKAQVQTGASQPVAQAPRVVADRACFADRKGHLVLIDLKAMRVLWEKDLPDAGGIFSDIEMGEAGVFAYGREKIFGFTIAGDEIMRPLTGVSAPPLLARGVLYYGTTDGFVVALRIAPYGEIGRVDVGATVSARPILADGFLYAGTKSGRLVKLDIGKF